MEENLMEEDMREESERGIIMSININPKIL